ncbi:hypothetical protein KSF_087020 [Reticulibacter mediterranei]|uniref:Uncharacterized protein n=1 Tax=Reticulibacter mediterranei TaxID=2778369 RepID=A0A8J3IN32_9CHLR|nr:hypothetical protein [Reticulibacter mediterranei]GHO98654.1 hypothetical protein KSF_087020 [Reticulibacter mediterranei]
MQRSLLAAQYRTLFEQQQDRDNTAEWRVYRDAVDLLESRTSLPLGVELLTRVCADCLLYARRDGSRHDSVYGTYGAYMLLKKRLYEDLMREVLICHYEELMESTPLQEDLESVLAPDILPLLREPALASVRTQLRDRASTLAAQAFHDPRTRKVKRKAATMYAHLLYRLGGSLTAPSQESSWELSSDTSPQQK